MNRDGTVMDVKQYNNGDGTVVSFVKLTELGKETQKGGMNVKIPFKTKNLEFFKLGTNAIGRVIKIKDIGGNSEIANACMKEKDSNGKYVYQKAYCNICYFNDFEIVDGEMPQAVNKEPAYKVEPQPAQDENLIQNPLNQEKKFEGDEDI